MNNTKEVLEIIKEGVDLEKLMDEVSFDLDTFEQANLQQPRLYLEAGKYRTWSVLKKVRADFQLEIKTAEIALELRNKLDKPTEGRINQELSTNEDVQQLRKSAYMAKVADEWAKQLLEVYAHRLQVLNNITKIRTGEMATELRAIKEKAAVDDLRKEANKVRRKIAKDYDSD